MRSGIIFFLALALGPLGVHAGESYKWTDEKGKPHYGDTVPAEYKDRAQKIGVKVQPPSEEQVGEAQERAAREKDKLEDRLREREEAKTKATAVEESAAPEAQNAKRELSCEEQWQQYHKNGACFARYRLANGGVRAEAFRNCTETKRPKCEEPKKE